MRHLALAILILLTSSEVTLGQTRNLPSLIETPSLADAVAAGVLPPIAARIPREPAIFNGEPGNPGGDLTTLMAGFKDTRLLVAYGYARLVGYTSSLTIAADLVRSFDDEHGDRVFTFHLRAGHRWSDGTPFTTEDFRFWFEDVAQNTIINPTGLPPELLVNGEAPHVEFPDPLTVRYSWSRPNPMFLPALARPNPLYIYMPAHYLKQFHEKYADAPALEKLVRSGKQRNWAALFNKVSNGYRNDNPDLPTLEPWVLRSRPPADRFVLERNPYFHRIDRTGRQLPYIDRILMVIADSKIIPVKTGAGESDLQARYLRFDNYTFLKEAEERSNYTVRLWQTAAGSQLALYPNFSYNNSVWRALLRDVRFRRALSLAIDRHEINQAIYYGLAQEGQNTVLPESPLYKADFRKAWASFDLPQANRLLDDLGLDKRNEDGIRLLPNGEPLQIIIESSGQSTEEADVLELIRDTWREVGIKLFTQPSQLTIFRNRIFAGQAMMSIAKGIDDGLVTPDRPPIEFAPVSQQQLQWPKWGQYYETGGHVGEAPDLPVGRTLMKLFDKWLVADTTEERARLWEDILAITAEEVPTIGIAAGIPQPVVVSNKLRNVPAVGLYNWDPGAQFGIYHPDQFWLADGKQAALPTAGSPR